MDEESRGISNRSGGVNYDPRLLRGREIEGRYKLMVGTECEEVGRE